MEKSNLTIYGVINSIARCEIELSFLLKDPTSPDLVFCKQLQISNLQIVLKDLIRNSL